MNEDRRSYGASSLRAFFDGQVHHLHELIGSQGSHVRSQEEQIQDDRQIVESFVDASNKKIRAIHGYSDKLRSHVRALYDHVLRVAEEIPGPVDLNHDAFRKEPLVNALFVCSEDIDRLLKNDPDVKAYLRAHDKYKVPVLYGLLTASKSEKRTLGVGMLGENIVRDVPRQAVNFSSYKIHTPCASSAELSMALKQYLFDHVVELVNQEMRSSMINQPFLPRDNSYETRVKSLANPEVYLNKLIEYLAIPANLLSIDKAHFKLSKLGMKLDSGDTQCANEFDLHELIWRGNNRDVVLQIARVR